MPTTTTNYGLIKPDTTDPILIGQLNDNSDAIDAALKENADAIENKPDAADIPSPSTAAPAMDGTAAAGTSTDYARADHVHPSDTSRANLENIAYKTAASSFSGTNMQVVFDEDMFSQSSFRGSVLMMFGTQKTSVSNTLLLVDFNDSGIKSIRYLTSGTGEVITAIGTIHNNKHGFNFTADANSYTYPCCLSLFANKDIKPNFTIVAQS